MDERMDGLCGEVANGGEGCPAPGAAPSAAAAELIAAAAASAYPPAVAKPSVLRCGIDFDLTALGTPAAGDAPAPAGDTLSPVMSAEGAFTPAEPASKSASTPAEPAVAPTRKRSLAARIAALFGRTPEGAVTPDPAMPASGGVPAVPASAAAAGPADPVYEVRPDGSVLLAPSVPVAHLPRLAGQPADTAYALVMDGLPLPPGGAAYLVELPPVPAPAIPAPASSASPAPDALLTAAPDAPAPASSLPAAPVPAAIVAYIDAFGRVFSVGSIQDMPPARVPEVRFERLAAPARVTGFVEVAASAAKTSRTVRLAEFVERPQGSFALVGTRVEFGFDPRGLTLPMACAVAFLALWLFPRNEGISLASVSVKEALAHLRAPNLFEVVDLLIADARRSEGHPLLVPPGLITYTARNLRAAGLEHLKPADLVPAAVPGPVASDPTPFLGGLPPAPATAAAHLTVPAGGDLLVSIQQALEASGITGLTFLGGTGPHGEKVSGIPSVRLIRTTAYANLLYAAFDRRQVSAEGARKLLAAESILNRLVLMAEELDRVDAAQTATWGQVMELDAWLIDQIGGLAVPYLDDAVAGIERAATGSDDLDVRMSFARGCEALRLPLRLEYAFRFNGESGDLAVDVECPSSALMPDLVWMGEGATSASSASAAPAAPVAPTSGDQYRERTYAEREGLASRYALHLAVLIGAVGFWAGPSVARVAVNCWHGMGAARGVDELAPLGGGLVRGPVMDEPACVAAVQFDREAFARSLATNGQRAAFEEDPFAFVRSHRHSFALDADAHLGRVQPLLALEDDLVRPPADVRIDTDGRPLTDRGADLLHAARVADLGIYENAARTEAADEVLAAFANGGADAALMALRDIHDRTENLLVREACLRVQAGVEAGSYTAASRREITEALSDIYGLQAGMRRAFRLLQGDPAAARTILEAMLGELDERVVFADTATRRYRYFDSYASRALYGTRCAEATDGRELRLVADEYYLCHYRLASILADSLDHAEEAIAHARRCVELAPSVAASYLRLARCYFCVFDYLSEIDTIKQMLAVAWNPTDVGLALYWLGYAFCLIDKPEVGMACYQRCTEYDASLTEAAVAEAAEFLNKRGAAPKTYTDRQIRTLLAREGVDLDAVDRNVDFLARAAGAAVDAGANVLARSLLSAVETARRDDALPPVRESLED